MAGIGALSKETGCHIETIRYYEKIGLLSPPGRSSGGHRLYNEQHRSRLTFIMQNRDLGFALEDIRELINLAGDYTRSCDEALEVVNKHLKSVQAKLVKLEAIKLELIAMGNECQTCCPAGKAPECTIVEITKKPGMRSMSVPGIQTNIS